MNYSNNPTPLTAEVNWKGFGWIILLLIGLIIIISTGSKVSNGIIRREEVVTYLQRMEDDDISDDKVPNIVIESSSSQSLIWGNLYMVRYTYILNGKLQKTVYCTKGPDNPLFCSPYPPQRR